MRSKWEGRYRIIISKHILQEVGMCEVKRRAVVLIEESTTGR